jgi:hypothetical protein
VVRGERLVRIDIEGGASDTLLLQRSDECSFVDHLTARGVDDDRGLLHARELRGADEARGGVGERYVQRDHVRSREHIVKRGELHIERFGAFLGQVRIVDEHVHAERARAARDLAADAAGADQPERLAVDLGAAKLAALPLAGAHGAVRSGDPPHAGEQQRKRQLGGRDRVAGRRVEHRHAELRRGSDIDRVDADARSPDHLEPRRVLQRLTRDLRGAADDHGVHRLDGARELLTGQALTFLDDEARIVAERRQPSHRDLVRDEHAVGSVCGHPASTSRSSASSASRPARVWSPMWPIRIVASLSDP